MIVSPRASGTVLVMQTDHQDQCAEMARSWGNAAFRRIDHWDDVVLAAGLHDEGWRGWEASPPPGPDGGPVDFPDVAREVHVDLYRDGIAAAAAVSERAGLLVSLHGSGLYEARFGLGGAEPPAGGHPPAVETFLREQERWRASLLTRLGPGAREWAWDAYRLLQAWDALSLYLVWRALPRGRTGRLPGVPRRAGDPSGVTIALEPAGERRCALHPWPFGGVEVALPVIGYRPGSQSQPEAPRVERYLAVPGTAG